jgi:hypothetical protein
MSSRKLAPSVDAAVPARPGTGGSWDAQLHGTRIAASSRETTKKLGPRRKTQPQFPSENSLETTSYFRRTIFFVCVKLVVTSL